MINGIQQIGLGVSDAREAFRWYRKNFGMDIPVFEEEAVASLMLPYTGGKPRARHAILAATLQGGGGLELWQYTERTPRAPDFEVKVGDLGIVMARMRAYHVSEAHRFMTAADCNPSALVRAPNGSEHFYLQDFQGSWLDVVRGDPWYLPGKFPVGGVAGCQIGVSDVERALPLYQEVLGYDRVVYDETGRFDDFAPLPGGNETYRRLLLTHSHERTGPFSPWLGRSALELVQAMDRKPRRIFEGRYWGDLGFIHLCFDVSGMDRVQAACRDRGFEFTIDSASSFDMGEAAGRFAYVEDPDGTLIEFVETHKLPLIKKLGWYLDLRRRPADKPLPRWMVRMLSLSRVKD